MVGHRKILDDLKSALERGVLGHGYIFYGSSMVGKRTAAREFAEFLEKENGGSPVLSDFMLIQPGENGSIGINTIREIKNFLWQKPNFSLRRTFVIDDAELLTTEAQNALLKLTEEPPVSSLLILVTTDTQAILDTISSRLPKIYFGIVPEKEIEEWIGDGTIAKKSAGKPGLAWRLANDEAFQEQIQLALNLLNSSTASRRDLIKKIIESDEFNFRKFLDAVIMNLAWEMPREMGSVSRAKNPDAVRLWHRIFSLYEREANFSLNPRLQLEALLS